MTMPPGSELLLIAILGSVLALDQNAGFSSQVSQPLIAAALAGAIVGHFEAAVATGAIVQLIWLVVQPVGGARGADTALAGLTAGVCAPASVTWSGVAWLDDPRLAGAVVVAVVMGFGGGALLQLQRRMHCRFLSQVQSCVERQDIQALERFHLSTVALHAARGALSVCVAVLLMPPLANLLTENGLLVPVGRLALGLGALALVRSSMGFRCRWFIAGAVAGLVIGVV